MLFLNRYVVIRAAIRTMARLHKSDSKDNFYAVLGDTIRLARAAAGKTQADLADQLNVSSQQFQKYESGTNRIPVQELAFVSDFLEVPIEQFFSQTGSRASNSPLKSLMEELRDKEVMALVESFKAIKDRRMRTALLTCLKSIAALDR